MSSTGKHTALALDAAGDTVEDVDRALGYVEEADRLIRERLPSKGWPQRRTVDRFLVDDRLERVLALYARAIRLDPREPAYPWNLAGSLSRLGLHDLALSYIERAIRVAIQTGDTEWADAGAHLAWAETALNAGQDDVALVALARAAALARPDSPAETSVKRLFRDVTRASGQDEPAAALASDLMRLAG